MGNGNDKNRQKNYKIKIDQNWGIINQSKGRMTISIQSQLNIFGTRAVDQSVINWWGMRQNLPTPLIIFLNSFPFRLFFRSHSSQSPSSFIFLVNSSLVHSFDDPISAAYFGQNFFHSFLCPFVSIFQPKIHSDNFAQIFIISNIFCPFSEKKTKFLMFWLASSKRPNLINLLPLFLSPPSKILHQSA